MNISTINIVSASTNSSYDLYLNRLDICMYSISFLFGSPLHCYVLWLIVTGSSGVASEFFILNLCICEIGICLNSLLVIFFYLIRLSHLIAWFLLGLTVTGRPLFQCMMCLERYLAVVHPVTFLKYKPLRYRMICCTAVWIIATGSCFCCTFCLEYEYYIYFSSIQYVFFFSIQLFCLVAVLRALKQSGPVERKRKEENHMKRRVFHVIFITTLTMSLIYFPYIISGLIFVVTKRYIQDLFSFSFVFFILGGFVQPVLYLHRSGKLVPFFSLKH